MEQEKKSLSVWYCWNKPEGFDQLDSDTQAARLNGTLASVTAQLCRRLEREFSAAGISFRYYEDTGHVVAVSHNRAALESLPNGQTVDNDYFVRTPVSGGG